MTCETDHKFFDCIDCTACTLCLGEYYMVTDQVWSSVADRGMLCIGCLEKRLGRMLHARDFTAVPINQVADMTDDASARFLNRLRNYQVRLTL